MSTEENGALLEAGEAGTHVGRGMYVYVRAADTKLSRCSVDEGDNEEVFKCCNSFSAQPGFV